MSEDLTLGSPSKDGKRPGGGGWVQFEDAESAAAAAGGAQGAPNETHYNGGGGGVVVGSARGSVNFAATADEQGAGGAALALTDIQVVDEQALRKSVAKDLLHISSSSANGSSSRATSSSTASYPSTGSAAAVTSAVTAPANSAEGEMDNVHLGEEEEEPRFVRAKPFDNGEILVTLLPVNERFPWLTPARFRPELVPEELMAPTLTLTVEDYVQTLEKLVTDMRFTVFNICYKRILVIWIVTAFTILLGLLFSGFQGVQLFACGVAWLILNAAAIFFCMWIKLRLNKQLEKCMASINAGLIKHNLVLGLDDRGKLSCHKVNLCFIYFEPQECIKKLELVLAERPEDHPQNGEIFDREAYLRDVENFEDLEVVVAGARNAAAVKVDRRAEKLFLHYIQRWSKDYLRRRLDWLVDDAYGRTDYASNTNPRHLRSALCPCQYIEEHLRNKRHRESLNPCVFSGNPCHWCD